MFLMMYLKILLLQGLFEWSSTCILMNPLDIGYKGDEGMCSVFWFVINFVKSFDEKGGPLPLKRYFGGPYCKVSAGILVILIQCS